MSCCLVLLGMVLCEGTFMMYLKWQQIVLVIFLPGKARLAVWLTQRNKKRSLFLTGIVAGTVSAWWWGFFFTVNILLFVVRDFISATRVSLSCHVALLSFSSLLTDDSHAFHRSVLCDDDPPWCHSNRHASNHRPTHTALPCVSISTISCYLGNEDNIDIAVWDTAISENKLITGQFL